MQALQEGRVGKEMRYGHHQVFDEIPKRYVEGERMEECREGSHRGDAEDSGKTEGDMAKGGYLQDMLGRSHIHIDETVQPHGLVRGVRSRNHDLRHVQSKDHEATEEKRNRGGNPSF